MGVMYRQAAALVLLMAAARLTAQYPLPAPAPVVLEDAIPLTPDQRREFEAAMKERDYPQAERILVAAHKANPDSAALLRLAGGVFFLDGNYVNAAIAFKKADKLEPLDPPNRFTLAMAFIALGRRDWARIELERLVSADPKATIYLYWLARLDYDDQKFAAAVEKLQRVIAATPDFMRAHDNLGLSLEALGRYEEAEAAYKKAIELNRQKKPSSPWPPLNLGIMLSKLGRRDEAETYLREALEYKPDFAQAHYRLGMILEKWGKLEEAIAEFRQAADLDPDYTEPVYAMARLYRRTGDMKQARKALKEFQKRKRRKEAASSTGPQHATRENRPRQEPD